MTEKEKMLSGAIYNANYDRQLKLLNLCLKCDNIM